jgi:hypothetical protein
MTAKTHLFVAGHGIPIGGTGRLDVNKVQKMVGLFGHRHSPFN